MKRRTFLHCGCAALLGTPVFAAVRQEQVETAADTLARAVADGQVSAAVLYVAQRDEVFSRAYGLAKRPNAVFLLASISKPICITALMTLFDRGEFQLDDPLKKFIPAFTGNGRDHVTMRHLLTHVSGLPDQLPENDALRKSHAPLSEFVARAIRTPLHFAPGSRYEYSSMAILLAAHVAELISGGELSSLLEHAVFQPLGMQDSAQGLGRFAITDVMPVQTEHAARESGGGDPQAKDWDWNSPYWRKLGAPWGGTHGSAEDVARFLAEFLGEEGRVLKPATARLMVTNHNPPGIKPRGLAMDLGSSLGGPGCSEQTFGHSGSTGTLAWADPTTHMICVVLTTLPARAVRPHPREIASAHVAAAMR